MGHKYVLILFVLLIAACKPNAREQAIIDYEEVKDGVRTDLQIKIISLEQQREILPHDSISWLTNFLFQTPLSADSLRKHVAAMEKRRASVDTLHRRYQTLIDAANENADTLNKYMHFAEATALELELLDDRLEMGNFALKAIARWEQQTGTLGTEWRCTYSFIDPASGTRKEITRIYFFNTDDKIISSRMEE